jgi:cytochrome P450
MSPSARSPPGRAARRPGDLPGPCAFRPKRFIDEQPGAYTWIPFGGGRRRWLAAVLSHSVLAPDRGRIERTRRRSITVSPRAGARAVLRERVAV